MATWEDGYYALSADEAHGLGAREMQLALGEVFAASIHAEEVRARLRQQAEDKAAALGRRARGEEPGPFDYIYADEER